MELEQAMLERRSIRKFRPEIPSEAQILEVIRLAIMAPSPMNRQDWQFAITRSPELRDRIVAAVDARWNVLSLQAGGNESALRSYQGNFSAFREAPVIVALSIRRTAEFFETLVGERAERMQGDALSAGMAIQNLVLAAHAQGLGGCVFTGCVAAEEEIFALLGIKRSRRLACLVALGFPAENPAAPLRKGIQDYVTWVDQTFHVEEE
jgi:nitroreductase